MYNNWMIFARLGDKKRTRLKSCIRGGWGGGGGGGVGEIKCIIFKENNGNPYEIHNNYIKLSIIFHPMIIFLGNKKI
jgi:hypothetical protein